MDRFRAGQIKESISEFEKAAATDPTLLPRLWQLGISQYYAEEFQAGRRQFELHRTVNPHDVENAGK